MKEKRTRERRIGLHSAQLFPFQNCSGKIIHDDRRRTPDRRLNSIWLELVTLEQGDFLQGWAQKMNRSVK